jgi:hypothetical protein
MLKKILIAFVILLVIVAAAIIVNTYFGDSIRKLFNLPIPPTGNNATGANGTGTVSLEDLSGKCVVAGGTCSVSCSASSSTPTSGSAFSFSFLNRIADSIASVFSSEESSEGSASQGTVVGTSTMSEIGSFPDYCTSELPKCCVSAIGTSHATSIPVNVDPHSESRLGCNNTCLELGLATGLCRISGAINFSCANSDYPNQTGKKLTTPPFDDWCAPYAPNQTSSLSIACCCYK